MIQVKTSDEDIKNIFNKYLKISKLDSDYDFFKSVNQLKADYEFYNQFIARTKNNKHFTFHPMLSGNRFLSRINAIFNYYDFNLLNDYLYIYGILKYLLDYDRINIENIKEFHKVVKYYMEIDDIRTYIGDFIGSSWQAEEILTKLKQ